MCVRGGLPLHKYINLLQVPMRASSNTRGSLLRGLALLGCLREGGVLGQFRVCVYCCICFDKNLCFVLTAVLSIHHCVSVQYHREQALVS